MHRRFAACPAYAPLLVGLLAAIASACSGSKGGLPAAMDSGADAAGDGAGSPDGGGGDAATDVPASDTGGVRRPIPGGGSTGGSISGSLNVFVIEKAGDKPLADTYVQIGEVAATALKGLTDANGFVSFKATDLKGPLTLTAGKVAYRTETLFDLDAESVTLTLNLRKPATVPTGKLRGTVDLSTVPKPPAGSFRAAFVAFTRTDEIDNPRNDVEQTQTGLLDDNLYAPEVPFLGKNEWVVTAPAGPVSLFALVVRIDTNGMLLNPDAWTFTITHVGVLDDLTLAKDEDKTGLKVSTIVPLDQSLKIELPDLPMGMTTRDALVLLDRGPGKLTPVAAPGLDWSSGIPVPKLEGPFAGASFWVYASTDNSDVTPMEPARSGAVLVRGIKDTTSPVKPASFLPTIADPRWSLAEIFFTPAAGAAVLSFGITPKSADEVWRLTALDPTRTKVRVPELPSGTSVEVIPTGDLGIEATALDIPNFNPRDAQFQALSRTVSRLSSQAFTGKR